MTAVWIISFLLVVPVQKQNDVEFSRDVLKAAHTEWIANNEAEWIESEEIEEDTYGYRQINRYQTVNGEAEVIYYSTVNGTVYDIGLAAPGLESLDLLGGQRIIERILWSASLTSPSILSTLWFVSTNSVHISYDGTLGSQDEVLKAFIEDGKLSSNNNLSFTAQQAEDAVELNLTIDQKEMLVRVKPNLYLYLNGQLDVARELAETRLTGDYPIYEDTDVHPFHELSIEGEAFSARFITVDRDDVQVTFNPSGNGYITDDPSREFSSGDDPELSELYAFWLTRNFPNELQSGITLSDEFEMDVLVEGAASALQFTEPEPVLSLVHWLGSSLVSYSEISNFRKTEDQISTTTYLLYYNPDLKYQHMIRSVDQYAIAEGDLAWVNSTMTILPAVRLDNIGELHGTGSFPVEGYERLFNSN